MQQFKHVMLVVTLRGCGFVLGGFLPSHHPEEKLIQTLPCCASSYHSQGQQDVWQNLSPGLEPSLGVE